MQTLMDGSKRAAKNLQTSAERKATELLNEEGKGHSSRQLGENELVCSRRHGYWLLWE